MKTSCLSAFCFLLAVAVPVSADVAITQLDDRIRVEIDGALFTEWRHKDWVAPFLYPVVGPTGENITRHFPMQPGVAGEEQDHPHHRSIRFSHSDVNGFNFWWAPAKDKFGHTATVELEKIEKLSSGKTGEITLWNQWLGDDKLVLRERVRLAFTPLANRQLLLDYDTELHAPADAPVVFGDKRDGGLLVRVAGTMKVESEKGERGRGEIVNSRGDTNAAAWGKRAEWTDYSGPDARGQTVGIAIFDHPANLRFPTHWHARTYGLMTANRFGTDHFKGNYDDHIKLSCRPYGTNCPACATHSGDYTLAAGKSLTLRNRFFLHHGDAQSAQVAAQYRTYTTDPEAVLGRMRALHQDRQWKEVLAQFAAEDFAAWPPALASEALHLRGLAGSFTKDGPRAEVDFKQAVQLAPRNEAFWLSRADNFVNNLNDIEQALTTYRHAFTLTGKGNGWQPLTATIAIARLLTDQVKPAEALAVLQTYGDMASMAPIWRIKMLRAYGHAYAAQGNDSEALAKFREALQLEAQQTINR